MCLGFVGAAHETTANLIANGLRNLLLRGDQLALLRANPELMPSAVEECLRFEPPFRVSTPMRAERDFELSTSVIPAGDVLVPWLAAGNRDPSIFEDPDVFDVRRDDRRHVAFGIGAHFCVGAWLARMETAVALRGLLELPGLELVEEQPRWRAILILRAMKALPVRWSTASSGG